MNGSRDNYLENRRYSFDTEASPDYDLGSEAEYSTTSMLLSIQSATNSLAIPVSPGHINVGNTPGPDQGDWYTVRVPAAINGSPYSYTLGDFSLIHIEFSLWDRSGGAFTDTGLPTELLDPADFLSSNFSTIDEFFANADQYSFLHLAFTSVGVVGSPIHSYRVVGNILGAETLPSPVPIPAAAWLFGTALAGLGFARRYQQQVALPAKQGFPVTWT